MSSAESLLRDLVAIPSVNPRGGASDGGETAVAEYVARWARAHGWRAELDEVVPGRANVTVRVPGSLPGTLLLQTHSDTVEVEDMEVPAFEVTDLPSSAAPGEPARRVAGRGVCDAKGQLAMFMAAIEQAVSSGQEHHGVLLSACIDEEDRFIGVLDLCERLRADGTEVSGAVVGEPTELRLVVSHKGALRGRIAVSGPGGHSSQPERVPNPLVVAAEIITHLAGHETRRLAGVRDALVGSPTLAVTMASGGEAINIIPREVVLHYDRRLVSGEDPLEVLAELRSGLEGRWTGVRVEPPDLASAALPSSAGSALARTFSAVLADHGLAAEPVGVPYGSDASKLARLGMPCIVFGAGSISQAHTAEEFLDLDQLEAGVSIVARLLQNRELES